MRVGPITPQNPSLLLSSLPDAAFYRAKGLRDLKKALKAPRFEGKAKNIIVFVGDGMGVSTHTMSRIYKGQKKGRSGEEESLVWEDWDYSGLIKVSFNCPLTPISYCFCIRPTTQTAKCQTQQVRRRRCSAG